MEKMKYKISKFCDVNKAVVKMDDVPDDVLEETSAARYHMLLKKSKLRYHKELEKN
jgi:hypothetical protein